MTYDKAVSDKKKRTLWNLIFLWSGIRSKEFFIN